MAANTQMPKRWAGIGPETYGNGDGPPSRSVSNHQRNRQSSAQTITNLIVHILCVNRAEHHRSDDQEPLGCSWLEGTVQLLGPRRNLGGSGCVAYEAEGVNQVPNYAAPIRSSAIIVPVPQHYQCPTLLHSSQFETCSESCGIQAEHQVLRMLLGHSLRWHRPPWLVLCIFLDCFRLSLIIDSEW